MNTTQGTTTEDPANADNVVAFPRPRVVTPPMGYGISLSALLAQRDRSPARAEPKSA